MISSKEDKHVTEVSANLVCPNNETSIERNGDILLDTKCKTICKQTQKALRIDNLFEKIEMDKFQYIKTYSADTISRFTDSQIDHHRKTQYGI
ncbi:unnamed protein product [Rhizophagus irregularis]|nr:unnamed protein product [Rhizophagus irregularis]